MQALREEVKKLVAEAIQDAFGSEPGFAMPKFSVEAPENPEHGDYATNVGLVLAKALKRKPMEIAEEITRKLITNNLQLTTSVASPGFINFKLADDFVLDSLGDVLKNPKKWGEDKIGKGRTMRVEYFQLNVAKRPHVGHVRSAILGDAIKRVLLALGFKAVSDTHVGDWGTQFGILLLGYKELAAAVKKDLMSGDPFVALEKLYIDESAKIETDPQRREKAKEEFAKLERGDKDSRKIWKWMVDISMKKLNESAKRLGLLKFELNCGESFYEKMMPAIVELALKKGVAKKGEGGAVIIDLAAEGLDEAVLIKSDGASTYLLRDLATIQYMKKKVKYEKNLYVVDVRQSLHFRQLFRVAALIGFEGSGVSEHVSYGFITLPEGAMSTRKGTAISLDGVLDEAKKRALAVIKEKNPDLKNAEKVAEMVGLGALKFFILAHNRNSDIVFRWDEALSFEGDTGPYLQYTYARLKSILRKVAKGAKGSKVAKGGVTDDLERRLAVEVLRFPEAVEDVLEDYSPNVLTNYLFNLARLANEFYHSHPVAQETDTAKKQLRVALVSAVALTLAKGLNLLGIEAPEEM